MHPDQPHVCRYMPGPAKGGRHPNRPLHKWRPKACSVQLAIAALLALMIAAGCAGAPSTAPSGPGAAPRQMVATINGTEVFYAEFKQELDAVYARIQRSGQIIDGTMYAQLQTDVLESLIHLVLMDQYSQKRGIVVDRATVQDQYDAAVARYPSKQAYRASLQEAGLTEADLLTRMRRSLAARQVVQSVIEPEVIVTDAEIRAYYDNHPYAFEHGALVHAAHILIQVNPLADAATKQSARSRIEALKARLAEGEAFAALARQYSDDPSSENGGDLGFFGAAQMAPAFETAAFALRPGQVSDVVTTQFGYHLIKVYDRKPAGKASFEEAGPRLRARFKSERVNAKLKELVERLKSEAEIQRFDLDPAS